LKVQYWFGLKINFKDNCVTGTFTLIRPTRVAPNAAHLVMALKRSIARVSLCDPKRHSRDAVRSARTPPPAFPFLQFNFQRATRRHVSLSRPNLTGSEDNEAPTG